MISQHKIQFPYTCNGYFYTFTVECIIINNLIFDIHLN